MEIPPLIRALRRHAGLSQRELAERLAVSASAVAAWEAGTRRPSVVTLEAALAAFDLDLALCARPAPPAEPLLRHLTMSLTMRLRCALGEPPSPYQRATGSAWRELLLLGRLGTVVLEPPVATALWVPLAARRRCVAVTVHAPRGPLPELSDVRAVVSPDSVPRAVVPVTVEGPVRVWVLPPRELLQRERAQLLQAAAALEAGAALDDAHRRRPEHRDPNEWREAARMLMTKGTDQLPRPRGEFSRAWRLGGTVSLTQVVRRPFAR